MGSNRFKKLFIGFLSIHFLVFGVFVVPNMFDEDKVVIGIINDLTANSKYELLDYWSYKPQSNDFEVNGQLGDFYSCMKKYRSIYEVKSKPGGANSMKFSLPRDIKLNLVVSDDEAFRFYFQKGSLVSGSYAINCSLSLMNKL